MPNARRTAFFVDGFNLYHAMAEDGRYRKYKWLNLDKLCRWFIEKYDTIEKIFYFTTYTTWDPGKMDRHKIYVRALESVKVIPVFGVFKIRDHKCRVCHKQYQKPEEKQTDVNIAITLLREAFLDTFDTAFIVSGDSDLIPCIKAVKEIFPTKKVNVVIPPGRHTQALKDESDFYMRIRVIHLAKSQFPDPITDEQGQPILHKPPAWA